MIDLTGIARHLRLPVDQIRIAAGLLEQGYQPGFIERYRADETGCLPRSTLWALKLEIDRQSRLQAAREKALKQLPKDAELDEEGQRYLQRAHSEVEIDAALRAFRSRRTLSQPQECDVQASQLLEKLLAYQGDPVDDLVSWAAAELAIDQPAAEVALQQAARLAGTLLLSDTGLHENLRRTIQRKAEIHVQLCEPTSGDHEDHASDADETDSDSHSAHDSTSEGGETSTEGATAEETEAIAPASVGEAPVTTVHSLAAGSDHTSAGEAAEAATSGDEPVTPEQPSVEHAATATVELHPAQDSEAAQTEEPAAVPIVPTAEGDAAADESVAAPVASQESKGPLSQGPAPKPEAAPKTVAPKSEGGGKKQKKSAAKMTPRQRRRRWLIAMLQPMKALKRPLSKLTAYQQLMLGRGRRSLLVKTDLVYDKSSLVWQARDTFVNDKHPFASWFAAAVEEALEHSLRAKIEQDAVADLEEMAAEKLLETAADQLRHSLMQRPVRGHCIMVVDAIGPKAAAVAIVDPNGQVLATDEIACSANPTTVNQNVVRLGELAHQYRVTLVALTNGPARRFLVLTLRELVKQSADSGLRWTMADRGGADAYAVGRTALRELSAFNRRHRAAIWIARCLQEPLQELLKIDVNRLRLGSFQRELPQEPLKKLVRETIADCIFYQGIDARSASVDELMCVAGVANVQAQQIATLAAQGNLTSRKQLLEQVTDWAELDARQAIGVLRIYGSEEALDATVIHPDDYRLAERIIENTELTAPPNAPPGWTPPALKTSPAAPTPESPPAEAAVTTEVPPASNPEETAAPGADLSVTDAPVAEDQPQQPIAGATDAVEVQSPEVSAAEVSAAEVSAAEVSPQMESELAPAPSAEESSAIASAEDSPASADAGGASPVQTSVVDGGPAIKPEYPEEVEATPAGTLKIDVEKLARGWQVGREKLRWIAHCLQDPFGDPRLSGPCVPLLKEMPSLQNLQPGTCLWAVVVGVADFGAFVELAPDCSGLIHISRLSSSYVEDPHQCVQVGDLVMAWVVSVDEKKNRVAMTALSPAERAEAEAAAARRKAEQEEQRRGQRGGQRQDSRSSEPRGGGHPGGGHGGQAGRGGQGGRGGQSASREGGRPAGGRSRGGPPGGRGGKGRSGSFQTKTVVVTSKKPKAPISEAMKEGDEPLRSFSDLLQFYEAKRTDEPAPVRPAAKDSQAAPQDSGPQAAPSPAPSTTSEAPEHDPAE